MFSFLQSQMAPTAYAKTYGHCLLLQISWVSSLSLIIHVHVRDSSCLEHLTVMSWTLCQSDGEHIYFWCDALHEHQSALTGPSPQGMVYALMPWKRDAAIPTPWEAGEARDTSSGCTDTVSALWYILSPPNKADKNPIAPGTNGNTCQHVG